MEHSPETTRLPGDSSPYWIQHPLDIRQQFKLLSKSGERVRLWYGPGESIVSLVLDVTQAGDIVMDVGPDSRSNKSLLAATRIEMHGNLNGVDLKCVLGPMRSTTQDGLPAFQCPLPKRLHRLQRREYHRVSIPVGVAGTCEIAMPANPDDPVVTNRQTVKLIDISIGGVAFEEPAGATPALALGNVLTGCRVTLDDMGEINVDLEVRYLTEINTRSGQVRRKVGCMFKRLSAGSENLVQRFINRLELARKTSGAA